MTKNAALGALVLALASLTLAIPSMGGPAGEVEHVVRDVDPSTAPNPEYNPARPELDMSLTGYQRTDAEVSASPLPERDPTRPELDFSDRKATAPVLSTVQRNGGGCTCPSSANSTTWYTNCCDIVCGTYGAVEPYTAQFHTCCSDHQVQLGAQWTHYCWFYAT